MAGQRRRTIAAVALVAAVVAALAVFLWPSDDRPASAVTPQGAAKRFLDGYVDDDGRVVRRDQGDDTVSEGQAYAMLVAAAIGDRDRFDRVWRWTREHLARPDGLFAWHWDKGRVVDDGAATDADIDVARALLIAARRFGEPSFLRAGAELSTAVLERETVVAGDTRVVTAGPWATERTPYVVNPSYFAPAAFTRFAAVTGERRWLQARDDSLRVLRRLRHPRTGLVPDWARVRADGRPVRASGLGYEDRTPRSGYDAVRINLRTSSPCDPEARRLAAQSWPFLREQVRAGLHGQYRMDGRPLPDPGGPPMMVSAAAAADAAGDRAARDSLLDRASSMLDEQPTYYGSALVALARLQLQTTLLSDCA